MRFVWPWPERERGSAVMTTNTHRLLVGHLARSDGQEDLCFILWRPSVGKRRVSAVVDGVVLPEPGERHLHGNVSFEDAYFLRAAALAASRDCGLALVHSHPGGVSWQGLSPDDFDAEAGHAARAEVLTGLPFLGLTLATGDDSWSCRFWRRDPKRSFEPWWCENVRVVGDRYVARFNPALRPIPDENPETTRTVSAWGTRIHADLVRIRVGVAGLGSVGDLVGEGLARTGLSDIVGFDFDDVERKNLDRLTHAFRRDASLQRSKAHTFVRGVRRAATHQHPNIRAVEYSVVEQEGFEEALDCDILFSCVDRPWPRAVLNFIAYAHLIPVVDGGISVDAGNGRMRGAEWRAHIAAPGRRCLECLGQYDPAAVAAERAGHLDDSSYLRNLPPESRLRQAGENVFAFAQAVAAAEVCQFLSMVVGPGGMSDRGAQLFHFTTGTVDLDTRDCEPSCLYSGPLLASATSFDLQVTGQKPSAVNARARRKASQRPLRLRVRQNLDSLIWRLR
jgi:molybdopterin-synthase adenylyltransferase